jgi:hypothetical protein
VFRRLFFLTGRSKGIPAAIINKWQGTKLQDIFVQQFRLNMLRHNISSDIDFNGDNSLEFTSYEDGKVILRKHGIDV